MPPLWRSFWRQVRKWTKKTMYVSRREVSTLICAWCECALAWACVINSINSHCHASLIPKSNPDCHNFPLLITTDVAWLHGAYVGRVQRPYYCSETPSESGRWDWEQNCKSDSFPNRRTRSRILAKIISFKSMSLALVLFKCGRMSMASYLWVIKIVRSTYTYCSNGRHHRMSLEKYFVASTLSIFVCNQGANNLPYASSLMFAPFLPSFR